MFSPSNMSHITCHMSCVTCHMSCVMCHMSCVTCHLFIYICFRRDKRCYWWRVCYQGGLPRLVFFSMLQTYLCTSRKPSLLTPCATCFSSYLSLKISPLTSFFVKSCPTVGLYFRGQNKSKKITKSVSCLTQQPY